MFWKIRFLVLLLAFLAFIAAFIFGSLIPIELNLILTKTSVWLFVFYFLIGTLKQEKT